MHRRQLTVIMGLERVGINMPRQARIGSRIDRSVVNRETGSLPESVGLAPAVRTLLDDPDSVALAFCGFAILSVPTSRDSSHHRRSRFSRRVATASNQHALLVVKIYHHVG